MKNSHDRRAAKIGTAHLSFGGWGDYDVWAEHGFTPKPKSAPAVPGRDEPGKEREDAQPDESGEHRDAGPRKPGHAARGVEPRPGDIPGPGAGERTRGRGGATLRTPAHGTEVPTRPRPAEPRPESHPRPPEDASPVGDPEPRGPRRPVAARPYVRGSVPPPPRVRNGLPPEVIVRATGRHRRAAPLDLELAAVCRMCQIPTSLAEVSAYLVRSLDVTRALVHHGIDAGLLVAEAADLGVAGRPPLALLHRVHQGLLRL